MGYFQAVRSGIEISMNIADLLEQTSPAQYNGANRVQTIREVNDTLQGRSNQSFAMLYSLLEQKCGGEPEKVEKIKRDAEAFRRQKLCRTLRYTLSGSQQYRYDMWDYDPQHPLKIISQPLFDHAAEHGFPPDFFTESYFDQVAIYCAPDNVDFSSSQFQSCRFSVCGLRGAVFDNAIIYDTDFQSSLLQMVNFTGASLAHSHFRDCDMVSVSFQDARLKSCLTLDSTMDRIDFRGATLDGSSFGRITASRIFNLHSATITQGGATQEEVKRLQKSVLQALQPPPAHRGKPQRKPSRTETVR